MRRGAGNPQRKDLQVSCPQSMNGKPLGGRYVGKTMPFFKDHQ